MKILLVGLLLVALTVLYFVLQRPDQLPSPATSPATTAPAQAIANPPLAAQQTPPSAPASGTPSPTAGATKPKLGKKPVAPPQTVDLFKNPATPGVFELASGALVSWRDFASTKPALVLFSTHPFLTPLPDAELRSIGKWVRKTPAVELLRRGRLNVADPALLPPQTVSAAIEAGLIGELIYVHPTTKPKDKLSLSDFQQRVFNAGFLNEQEALALQLQDGVISGTVRGIPFRCVHPDALPKISRPVIVHIDLGYFKDLYINDIKTPLYNLLYQTAKSIRDTGWGTLAATLSYSNQEAEFSLDTRFMISNLATIMVSPNLLEGGTPPTWKLLADARFARAMFAETTADELTEQAVQIAPDDPDALYALTMQKFAKSLPDEAFSLLDLAVAQDPGYALAYVQLADTGVEKGQYGKAVELLSKAAPIIQFDPFIRIKLADLLIQLNRGAEALPILHELQQRPWSQRYHPNTPTLLKEMQQVAEEISTQPKP